jgi:hypothetical protein
VDAQGQSFYTTPEQEACQVRSPGCTGIVAQLIFCRIEGRSLPACQYCFVLWRTKVRDEGTQVLVNRCPNCADWHPATIAVTDVAASVPLAGAAAQAINDAMWKEGLLQDVRRKILIRLANEYPWLATAFEREIAA